MPNNAGTRVSWYGMAAGAEPAGVNAETGVTLSSADPQVSTDPVGVPITAPNTFYSWLRQLALEVTVAASPATTILNGTIRLSQAPPTGVRVFWQADTTYRPQLVTPTGTVTGAVAALATAIPTSVNFAAGDLIQIGVGAQSEQRLVGTGGTVGGSTPITVGVTFAHANGEQVTKTVKVGPANVASEDTSGSPAQPTIPTGPASGLMAVLTTTSVVYDTISTAGSGNGGTTGRKGKFIDLVGGVCTTYAGLPASNSLGNLVLTYDEQ